MRPIAAVGKTGTKDRNAKPPFTSWPGFGTGLRNAVAEAVDQEIVTDGPLTTQPLARGRARVLPAIIEQFTRTRAPG